MFFNWVNRKSGGEGQLDENKNTILPFTRKQPQKEGEGMGEEEDEEESEEMSKEETSEGRGEMGEGEVEKEMVEGEVEKEMGEGEVEKEMGEKEVEKEATKSPQNDSHYLKQKANSLSYTTPHNTRYGLRSRAIPSSVWEPIPTKVEHSRTQPTDKDISLDSGKATSQDTVMSSPIEAQCTDHRESTVTRSQEDKTIAGMSQDECESIFCSTPAQPPKGAVVGGACQLTPMQMLVAHLPNEQEEDLQGYLSQQVDSETSAEVPDICSESNPTPSRPPPPPHIFLPITNPLTPLPKHTHTHNTHNA